LLILIVRSSVFGRTLPALTKQSRCPRFQSALGLGAVLNV
jgi:hypothetical protein